MVIGESFFDKGHVSEFDKKTFDEVDALARWLIIKAHANRGIQLIPHPNTLDVDLISPSEGCFLEVGIKLGKFDYGWDRGFPHEDLSIEKRKCSYRVDPVTGALRNVKYVYISKDLTHGIFTMGFNLLEETIQYRKTKRANRFGFEKEPFYHVPLDKCIIHPLGVDLNQIPEIHRAAANRLISR